MSLLAVRVVPMTVIIIVVLDALTLAVPVALETVELLVPLPAVQDAGRTAVGTDAILHAEQDVKDVQIALDLVLHYALTTAIPDVKEAVREIARDVKVVVQEDVRVVADLDALEVV